MIKIGALWKKNGKNGEYLSGEVEINNQKARILVFKNTKNKDAQPDYTIFIPDSDQSVTGDNTGTVKDADLDPKEAYKWKLR